jgi:hypothetical protein
VLVSEVHQTAATRRASHMQKEPLSSCLQDMVVLATSINREVT